MNWTGALREVRTMRCDEHLARWRADRGDGHRLSPEEAFQVGKALFIDRAIMGRE